MSVSKLQSSFFLLLIAGVLTFTSNSILGQSVQVGAGSYSTVLPDGVDGPQFSNGNSVLPKVSDTFDQLVTTNDFWSSLIFPFFGNSHSSFIYAHPLNLKAINTGLQLGYSSQSIVNGVDYLNTFKHQLVIGVNGLTALETVTESYGDWTATALWENEAATMEATFGHGLPYTFFEITGGNATINTTSTPDIWHNQNEVLGVTIDNVHFGIFAPTGSVWSGTEDFESSLNDKGFLSIAVLPDTTSQTLELFRSHAYAFVTNTTVSWNYDEDLSKLTTDYTYITELRDSSVGNLNETLTALYRHQWLNTSSPLTSLSYESPRGTMKLYEGNTFSTELMHSGILPSLPDLGSYNRIQLLEYVQDVSSEVLSTTASTYNSGKEMVRFSELVHIADQLGAINERDYFLTEIKNRLEDWFTIGESQEYSYIDEWDVLTGYPSGFGADRELNDQHFHTGHLVKAAATVAQYDSVWASMENWGGMVNVLISNVANWDRSNTDFPFLRNHDVYAGHSWASGHADFSMGNNQESSSESMNFSAATFLWGEITKQDDIRDLGIYLYATETTAIEQYWFDIDEEVFPESYPYNAVGMVWGNGGRYNTWFGNSPEFIHGINFLPVTAASVYLGRNTDYIPENYEFMVSELGSQPTQWKDVFWSYLALSDPELAISYYEADPNYEPFDGESKARTYHWLFNLKEIGHFNPTVHADIPSYGVFVNDSNDTTYIAYNSSPTEQLVSFTDGFELLVPPNQMESYRTGIVSDTLSPAPNPISDPANVISIFSDSYSSATNVDFDVEEDQTTNTSIISLNGNNTLKYDLLDFQTMSLTPNLNVFSRDSLHINYWTSDATQLSFYLIDESSEEDNFNIEVVNDSWQQISIPLSAFSDTVSLGALSKLRIEGNGSVYVDNIFFFGSTPVPLGPQNPAPTPEIDSTFVISIFSDSFTNIENTNFNPNWNQTTSASIISIAENNVLLYENLNYQGTELGETIDVSDMGWFHLDYWTEDATELDISLISPGPLETPYEITVQNNAWISVNIPLSEYSEVVNLSEVFQLKIEGNGTVYLDNLYFGKNAELVEAPIPTHDTGKVISLFSDSYEDGTVDTWSASWDQATLEDIQINGNNVKYYSNLNFAGIEFIAEQVDATNLTHFRFDLLTQQPTVAPAQFSVKLVDFGANGVWSGGDDVEHELFFDRESAPSLVSNQWISFDIPIDDFENMVTREHLSQILFLGTGGLNEVYIDNIYFYGDAIINSNEDDENEIPTELELSQNYPNPFNPSTNIEFSLPKASQVSLIIYNTLGQQVSTLLDTRLNPGTHSVIWNAAQAPTGVYFYQLKTANATLTKRMLLIK